MVLNVYICCSIPKGNKHLAVSEIAAQVGVNNGYGQTIIAEDLSLISTLMTAEFETYKSGVFSTACILQ